jgi:hypothetical protein
MAGGHPIYFQDSRTGPGSAFLFLPTLENHLQYLLRLKLFNCPTAGFQSAALGAFFCEPEVLAADLLRLLPGGNEPLIVFGQSGGSIYASLVACYMARTGRTVKLLLSNPLCQWWPQKNRVGPEAQKQYDALKARAESDPQFAERLNARGEILTHLADAVRQHDLRVKVIVSERNQKNMKEAQKIIALIGGDPILLPTDDHHILPWLCRLLVKESNLYASLFEKYRRENPAADLGDIERLAKADEAAMRGFWAQYPDLQAIADAL